jgi:hypothetical protein
MRPYLEIMWLDRYQLGPTAEAVIGHGQKCAVAKAAGAGIGRCKHAADQVAGEGGLLVPGCGHVFGADILGPDARSRPRTGFGSLAARCMLAMLDT